MSTWTDDTFFIRGEEIKASKMELGENVYHAIAYEGSFYALENSKVLTSSLTSVKNVKDWLELNAKPNRRIGAVKTTIYKEPVYEPEEPETTPKVKAGSGFSVEHTGKRDFRIMFNGRMVETWGTNAAAQKRVDKYKAKLTKWLAAGKSEDTFKI